MSQRPKGGNIRMNKYELALVVSAKIEDDAITHVPAVLLQKLRRLVRRD